jgi:hypothetical protein
VYDFYINMDNVHLKRELKAGPAGAERLTAAQFKYGLVLVGLALLQDESATADSNHASNGNHKDSDEVGEDNVEDRVARYTRAIAPVLVPMITSLAELDDEAVLETVASGEAV